MHLSARLILVAVLAAFAVSSVAHAAASAKMAAGMVASGAVTTDMADCDACVDPEPGAKGIACNFVCGAGSFAAVFAPQSERIAYAAGKCLEPAEALDFCGLSSPPAKQPPRTLA